MIRIIRQRIDFIENELAIWKHIHAMHERALDGYDLAQIAALHDSGKTSRLGVQHDNTVSLLAQAADEISQLETARDAAQLELLRLTDADAYLAAVADKLPTGETAYVHC